MLVTISACAGAPGPVTPSGTDSTRTADIIPENWYGSAFTTPLIAGQKEAGVVTVTNDSMYLYIDVEISDDCYEVVESHVAVAETLEGIPTTGKGNPKIGQFPYTIDDPIPLGDLEPCIGSLVMAVHVVIQCIDEGGTQSETGWAEGEQFNEGRSWAMYINYDLRKGLPIPDPNCLTIQSFYPGTDSYWDTYILDGLGDLEEIYRMGYEEGDPYRGWCVDLLHTMNSGKIYYCAEIYPTTDPDLFPEGDPRFNTDWNIINWIFNHREGYTNAQVQDAIWYFTNGKVITGPALELALEAAEHPDYDPQPCGWLSVLLRAGNNQLIVIEIDP